MGKGFNEIKFFANLISALNAYIWISSVLYVTHGRADILCTAPYLCSCVVIRFGVLMRIERHRF